MKKLILLNFFLVLGFNLLGQSYLGKTKEEIIELAHSTYEEVEEVKTSNEEGENRITLKCDEEINEYLLVNDKCVKFNSRKSYKCKCLADDIKAYNENLRSTNNLTWESNDGSKSYQIKLEKDFYVVSIIQNDLTLIGLRDNNE